MYAVGVMGTARLPYFMVQNSRGVAMQRRIFFVYGLVSYLLFFGVFAYMAGFVGNFLVPKSIDTVVPGSVGGAVAINLLLLAAFAAQHSIMARPAFKRVW